MTRKLSKAEKEERAAERDERNHRKRTTRECHANPDDHDNRYRRILVSGDRGGGQGGGSRAVAHLGSADGYNYEPDDEFVEKYA